jgi:hypothetical protein
VLRNEEQTGMYLLNYSTVVDAASRHDTIREYEAIYNAIIQRDPEVVARVATYHGYSLREHFVTLFNGSGDEGIAFSKPFSSEAPKLSSAAPCVSAAFYTLAQ